MQLAWLSLIMIITSLFLYPIGWNYLQSLPKDREGNIPFMEKTFGVFMVIAALALGFFGLLWTKHECDTELIRRNKASVIS